jgi:DNA-directed RNA polymerase specialized sigma24 family protein
MSDLEDTGGNDQSVAILFGEIMGELRLLSTLYMKTNPPDVTLQPTVIVSEAFVRLAHHKPEQFKDEDDFKATASVILRQVFAERAKKRLAEKVRAADAVRERNERKPAAGASAPAAEPELPSFEGASPEMAMALENALEALSEADDRSARVAELKIFGSLPMATIAPIVGLTEAGAEKDWRFAKAFIAKHLKDRGKIG